MAGRSIPVVVLFLAALTFGADDQVYRSVSVDGNGQLHIFLDSGKEILPEKTEGQVAFDSPLISTDGQTAGWLIMYPYPVPPGFDNNRQPISGALALYRAGHVIQTFSTQQIFWDWQFQDGGKRVAYSTGPTHGGIRPRHRQLAGSAGR